MAPLPTAAAQNYDNYHYQPPEQFDYDSSYPAHHQPPDQFDTDHYPEFVEFEEDDDEVIQLILESYAQHQQQQQEEEYYSTITGRNGPTESPTNEPSSSASNTTPIATILFPLLLLIFCFR